MKKTGRSGSKRTGSAKIGRQPSRRRKVSRSGGSKGGFLGKSSKRFGGSKSPQSIFGSIKNLYKQGKGKQPFIKPPHDPGDKPIGESDQDYMQSSDEELIPDALRSTVGSGCGCCSSIGGLIWLVVIGIFVVIIVFITKCSGC